MRDYILTRTQRREQQRKAILNAFFNACGVIAVFALCGFTIYQMMIAATN